jgi:hypothetical protein
MECNLYGNSYAYLNKLKAEHNTEAPTTLSIVDSIKLQVMTMNPCGLHNCPAGPQGDTERDKSSLRQEISRSS